MINFDIVYKKKLEIDSIKLLGESQLRQLKLMICGKYQLYDYSKIFIYYENNKISANDNTKLRDIFKTKKVKIEITEKEKMKIISNDNKSDYINQMYNTKNKCSCGGSAIYICEKCEEFLCNFCLKKKKHITHDKNIIKLKDYSLYIKKYLKEMANELDNKILNDEAYKFLKYWEYDKDKEIKTINNLYDFIKEQIEDIKQLQIDNIISLSEGNKYNELKLKIKNALNDYTNFNINAEIEEILEQKKILMQNSQEIVVFYNNIRIELLKYTKIIKELQWFNQEFQKLVQTKFNIIKKKFNGNNNFNYNINLNTTSYNFFNTTLNNDYLSNDNESTPNNNRILSHNTSIHSLNNNLSNSAFLINVRQVEKNPKKNKSRSQMNNKLRVKTKTSNRLSPGKKESLSVISPARNKEKEFQKLSQELLFTSLKNNNEKKITNYNSLNSSPHNESKSKTSYNNLMTTMTNKNNNNYLLKLKDKRKILIFNLKTQLFKEKIYYDKGNFRKELSSDADVIQLNLNNNLYMLSGKDNNKFYYYNFIANSIFYITNTLFSHYYGAMIFCKKINRIFLLGGNNQKNCEMFSPFNNNSSFSVEKKARKKWKLLPPLNEERQEFGAMIYNDDYLYVFFGFSHIKGVNLNSIERMEINTREKFETVYVNENITLSSIGCAILNDECEDNSGGGILLLGGFDGIKYIETSLVFNPEQMKIRECDIIIPNINKHFQFLFHKETAFIKTDNDLQMIFDMKNNAHVLTNNNYELFSEIG